jgi:hypothetical protein
MYRTGDVARFRRDGVLEFVGRRDQQVKVRGVRIELAEVEAAVRAYSSVREAVVVASADAMGATRLVAYVVTDVPTAADEVHAFAKQRIPAYMVPTVLVLDALPLLPNGKVNRRALPAPLQTDDRAHPEELRTETERALAVLWCDVLRLPRVSAHDNFFEVGGHSLLATRLVSRIRKEFSIALSLRAIFDAPEFGALAARIDMAKLQGRSSSPKLERKSRPDRVPLAYAQEVFWRWEHAHPNTRLWIDTIALNLKGPIVLDALKRTLDELVRRHEVLRTAFPMIDGSPVQVVSASAPLALPVLDLAQSRGDTRDDLARIVSQQELDVEHGPLFRACVARLRDNEHVLLLTSHHLTCDLAGATALVDELCELYDAFVAQRPSRLAEPVVQMADFALWQRQLLAQPQMAVRTDYWLKKLADAKPTLLPYDHPPRTSRNREVHHCPFTISKSLTNGLQVVARKANVAITSVLLAAYGMALRERTGQSDFVVAMPTTGRDSDPAVANLIGSFSDTIIIRTDLAGVAHVSEAAVRVHDARLDAEAHELPLQLVIGGESPADSALMRSIVHIRGVERGPTHERRSGGLTLEALDLEFAGAQARRFSEMNAFMVVDRDSISGDMEAASDVFERATITSFIDQWLSLLETVAGNQMA